MKHAAVCFLWHMHQPYYTDPVSRSVSMPWVRLHATKAYYDMAWLLAKHPGVRVTFNFTPSLLLQLRELIAGSVSDLFLDHAARPATDLTPSERAFIVRHFFAANWPTMVRPYPRYHELLVRRGTEVRESDLERMARQFTTQELRDIQVWHNLAWFGYGAVAQYPRLADLRRKGRAFTEEDKQEVLTIQRHVVEEIIPRYRHLSQAGQIELTTSPFYHPILPLVIDTDSARRARSDLRLPERFQAPEDAEAQLGAAVALHTDLFGSPPAGLWPSEGSVCPELIPMAKRAGFRWLATDEGVLACSLQASPRGWDPDATLYHPFRVGAPGEELSIIFRDRTLSDHIGFVYWKTTPELAVENAVHRLADITRRAQGNELLIPVILDGENPWEHYHDNGERFLSELYRALSRGTLPRAEGVRVSLDTVSHALAQHPPGARLEHLHSGSWINADFKIWIGHSEDNRAWDLIRLTRAHLVDVQRTLPPETARQAWEELYAAEGSDWFWWYGDDFSTDYKDEFDRLFRTHLRNVYALTGAAAPDILNEPISDVREITPVRLPVALLSPKIDGLVTDFFEWHGAGIIDPSPALGAMWKASEYFAYIGFGFSLDALFLRLDPGTELQTNQPGLGAELHLFTATNTYRVVFSLSKPAPETFTLLCASHGDPFTEVGRYGTISSKKVIELAVPFKDLQVQPGQDFRFNLVITRDGLELERYPRYRPVAVTAPDLDFEARLWRV